MYESGSRRGLVNYHKYITDLLSGEVSVVTLLVSCERVHSVVSVLTCCASSAGLSGTDLSFLRLLQCGKNPFLPHNL